MKYPITLFGYSVDGEFIFDDEQFQLVIDKEDQASLKYYLIRALPRYNIQPSAEASLEDLIKQAIAVEQSMKGFISEPRLKLPYEFQPEIKEKLIEAAEIQGISATKLLIRLIEKKYQSVVEQGR
ncbi:hypothetical protein [Paenibacillus sp. S150]|uniref:hypothetical protein n=1 Tax=Paenibacillus sp. S150 TaxID=2749826 RepID=UPI001C5718B4|nr:hypothetical protein [Paenibacillus sp. S150]MBW4084196.1 hypothetical protein [Paenibacillus sp. S150]